MPPKIAIERDPLTPELEEKAERELRETPQRRQEALEELRKLLKDDGTLRYKTTDDILLRYLRPTKFYPDSALALVRLFVRRIGFRLVMRAVLCCR